MRSSLARHQCGSSGRNVLPFRQPNMAPSKRTAIVRIPKAKPLDLEFLEALEKTLPEWDSDNDERAYRDLENPHGPARRTHEHLLSR